MRGHETRDSSPVPGDHDGLATLHLVEELRKLAFHAGCLNFTHVWSRE